MACEAGGDNVLEGDETVNLTLSNPTGSATLGTPTVQVIIGEEGKVIAAAAISGHPLLFGVSVAAAREAEFTPTLLHEKPVKVTGVIKYNFVSQ